VLGTRTYLKGIKVRAAEMKRLDIQGHPFHPDWNTAAANGIVAFIVRSILSPDLR
jgi:hypothetical protein